MNPAINDWASSDPTQNITLAEADQFKNQLAGALTVQFAERFVKTTSGAVVNEPEIRRSPLPAAPLNLWGTLAGVGAVPVNVAQMRAALRAAARSTNAVGDLEAILQQALPKSDAAVILLRLPAVAAAIGSLVTQIG